MDLFAPAGQPHNLLHRDGSVHYYGPVMDMMAANHYFEQLFNSIDWQHDQALINGQVVETARKIAWYGSQPYHYTYSGITKVALPWNSLLLELKSLVERESGETYNACLINLYHNGSEGMAWHSDAEKDLKKNGAIASLTLGGERKFSFKHKVSQENISLYLQNGSLLVMKGTTQSHWLHRLPPTQEPVAARINLTFRTIDHQFASNHQWRQ